MRHPNTTELEQFINGKLAPERLLELDAHISSCEECRSAISSLPARKKAALDLGAMLLGANDCPEYEELSAYVDNQLDAGQTRSIRAHVNLCELCTRDVSRMAELRSHAAMRQAVTVGPGMSKAPAVRATPIWRRVLAGVSVAAIVAAAVFSFNSLMQTPNKPAIVAQAPTAKSDGIARNSGIKAPVVDSGNTKPVEKPAVEPETVVKAPTPGDTDKPVRPVPVTEPKALLKDGAYKVINYGGKMVMAKATTGSPRTALEAKVAASINEKLATGKIKLDKPVQMAMNSVTLRSGGALTASAVAAKLSGPSGRILITNKPTLSWSKVDEAQGYRVRVYNADSGEVLVDKTTNQASLTLSAPLPRGEVYTWRVGVRFSESDGWTESAPAKFAVLSSDGCATIQNVKSRMPGSHLALGTAYESLGLHEEAQREYAAVRSANPGSSLAQKLR